MRVGTDIAYKFIMDFFIGKVYLENCNGGQDLLIFFTQYP